MNGKKCLVHCRSYTDGVMNRSWDKNRMVYSDNSGHYVSLFGNKKGRDATPNSDGSFNVEYHARTIQALSLQDVLDKIRR